MMNFEIKIYSIEGSKFTIERMTNLLWVIRDRPFRVSRDGSIDIEPLPSNRTREWCEQHTFTLDEAKKMATELKSEGLL